MRSAKYAAAALGISASASGIALTVSGSAGWLERYPHHEDGKHREGSGSTTRTSADPGSSSGTTKEGSGE